MSYETPYPAPILGVSTLSPRNRVYGQASIQTNFRSDPVNKLTRRPPLQWGDIFLEIDEDMESTNILHHTYQRNGISMRYLLNKTTAEVWIYADTELVYNAILSYNGWLDYVGENMVAQTVEDKTYFVNTDIVVAMSEDTDVSLGNTERVTHINVITALNYSETVQVNVYKSDGTYEEFSYSVTSLTSSLNYDEADESRATTEVASQIADLINNATTLTDVVADSRGSSVAVWETDRENWVTVEIEAGQGDNSVVAINKIIESSDSMPLYAVVDTLVAIQPDPTTDDGVYYLKAERSSDTVTGNDLEEVVWVESRSNTEPFAFDHTTMPHYIETTLSDGVWSVTTDNQFDDREKGDDESNEPPAFVGYTINNIGYFQKRLVFLSSNDVTMSEADEEDNFWLQSAVQTLVTDTASISSSATDVDILSHVIPHNRDLLVTTSNSQFKIDGTEGISPSTISMALTTAYENLVSVAPVGMGNSVYMPIDYGDYLGIQEYTAEANTGQDHAVQISRHVVGYMNGEAKLLVGSSNLEMLALTTTGDGDNVIFVYEQYTKNGDKVQQSWSKWTLPETTEILDMKFVKDKLSLFVRDSGIYLMVKELDMYSQAAVGDNEIFLDDLLRIETDGSTVTLPDEYNTEDMVVILGDGTDYPSHLMKHTRDGTTVTLNDDAGAGYVYVGKKYESRYSPTRPFKYDDNGIANTANRVRVSAFVLGLVDTHSVNMSIVSDYSDYADQSFNSRYLGRLTNTIGTMPFTTDDVRFAFSQDASLATAEFYCNDHLGCTIAAISWQGQYYQSKRSL